MRGKVKQIRYPKSVCSCGHNGDGPGSQHHDSLQPGHGACRIRGCPCQQFSWAKFTDAFEEQLQKRDE